MTSSNEDKNQLNAGERPTLKTISRITGLAVATVSRALNDAPDISQKTKKLVQPRGRAFAHRKNQCDLTYTLN